MMNTYVISRPSYPANQTELQFKIKIAYEKVVPKTRWKALPEGQYNGNQRLSHKFRAHFMNNRLYGSDKRKKKSQINECSSQVDMNLKIESVLMWMDQILPLVLNQVSQLSAC